LRVKFAKDGRSRKWCETSNRSHIHSGFVKELQCAFKNRYVIVVKTKNQTGLDGDAGVVEFFLRHQGIGEVC
jgi:hypothetical protein